jgi:hypothetical protein
MPLLPDGTRYRPPLPRPEAGNRHQNWHPCYSHPQAAELAIAAARRAFAQGELCYSLGINDGLRVQCACPDCLAQPWPAPYYRFVTTVANALADTYPPHLVGVLVYGDVRQPPADLRLPPNVFALVTTGSRLSDWAPHARHLGRYAYAYGSGFAIPSLPLKAMAHNARVDRAAAVESFRAETLPVWAYDAPKLYLQSKLLWDSGYDLQAGLDHFCRAAYGPAGPTLATFFRLWAAHWDYLVPDDASPDPAPLCDMARWRSPAAQLGPVPDALWQDSARLLEAARPLLATPDQRDRFAMLDTTFARGRTQADILRAVAAMTSPELPAPRLVAELLALRQRDADLAATLAAHPEWHLGTSEYDALAAYWNVPQQLAAALLTALVRLRQQGPLPADLAAQLPPELQPLAQAAAQPAPPPLVEVSPDGVYWARADLGHRFIPMTATAAGATLTATLARAPTVVTEGSQAGDYAEHWAYALAPVRLDAEHRVLYLLELTATGRDGSLALSLTNPWRTQPGDGLPVGFSLPLDGQPQRRVLIVEPVTAESARKLGPAFAMRLGLLFSPTAATAACTVQVTLSTLLLPLPDLPPPAEELGP